MRSEEVSVLKLAICIIRLTTVFTEANNFYGTPSSSPYRGGYVPTSYSPSTYSPGNNQNNHHGEDNRQNPTHLGQSAFLLQLYCINRNMLRIQVVGGYVNVHCIHDREHLKKVMFDLLPKEGFVGNSVNGWFAADKALQSDGYVPICGLHCAQGTRPVVPRGNYTEAGGPSTFSIGCSNFGTAQCKRVCSEDIYYLQNGYVSCDYGTHIGSTCQPKCNSGYSLVGPRSKQCGPYFTWNTNEPFKCLTSDVAVFVKNLMKNENRTVNNALEHLREMLEAQLSKQAAPSTSRNSGTLSDEERAEAALMKLFETILINLSKSSPVTLKNYDVCSVSPKNRRDCGYPGISKQECQQNKCCWDDSIQRTAWCFYRIGSTPPPTHSKITTKLPGKPFTTLSEHIRNNLPLYFLQPRLPTQFQPQHDFTKPNSLTPPGSESQCHCAPNSYSERCLPITGRQNPVSIIEKISCGLKAPPHLWPWHAVVFHGNSLCGGTLISKEYVVTAAHCVSSGGLSVSSSNNEVYLGVIRRDEVQGRVTRKMKRIIRHPFYLASGEEFVQNDIALIQLSEPVEINDKVNTLCLPKERMPVQGQHCTIVGFGKQTPGGTASMDLLSGSVPILSTSKCKQLYGSKVNPLQNLCAGGESIDACKGDSGGALVCSPPGDTRPCASYLAGITSFGKGPCGTQYPGVYVNVAHYQKWIESHIYAGL